MLTLRRTARTTGPQDSNQKTSCRTIIRKWTGLERESPVTFTWTSSVISLLGKKHASNLPRTVDYYSGLDGAHTAITFESW
jgi:hypothetical protein